MRLQNPFAALSPTGLDSQVLLVLAKTEGYLTVAEIHRLLPEGGSLEGVRKSTRRLTDQGTVLERIIGRSSAYGLNVEHLLAEPIRQIALAKQRLITELAQRVAEWPKQPLTVKLFGSAARNEMTDSSDIDIIVVMPDDVEPERVQDLVDDLTRFASGLTGNDVRPLLYYGAEVATANIFDSILEEGIDIAGDPSWLRKHLRSTKDAS